jgi:hypothetical protein
MQRTVQLQVSVGSIGSRARSWGAAMASDALHELARRYRAAPAGTHGTRDPRAVGSATGAPETKDSQGVAGHGTPGTPGTRVNSNVPQEAIDILGSPAADQVDATTRLTETAAPRSRGQNPDLPDPAPPVSHGLLRAAPSRPPSWADPAALPSLGCQCSCCRGQRWWCERVAPKGWRCLTCHPPDHLPADVVTEVMT